MDEAKQKLSLYLNSEEYKRSIEIIHSKGNPYGDCYDKKDDALDVYKEELAKNNGDVIKTLIAFNKNTKMPFGFMQYFVDYKECIDYLGVTEDEFNEANCLKWSNGLIERFGH